MDVSLNGGYTVKFGRSNSVVKDLSGFHRSGNFSNCNNPMIIRSFTTNWKIDLCQSIQWPKFSLRVAAQSRTAVSNEISHVNTNSNPKSGVKLYVGLPMDSISDCNAINHGRAISAGLKALKLLGVEGVELPIWWGVAEKETMGKYEWSGYRALIENIQKEGMKLHVSFFFHGCPKPNIPLPKWVMAIGESKPEIFFTDSSGKLYKNCLSFGVDDLPVLSGRTPLQVYKGFVESFKTSFSPFIGSTITGISIGLGPDGELRYPSHHENDSSTLGAGEFQCYDHNMTSNLRKHAEELGNPLWGLSGPHDAPTYDQNPNLNNFFKEGGSWETPYGDFFLSWYSTHLISHAQRLLSMAASTFSDDKSVTISGKIPLIHSFHRTKSHPSELTAGFYNTVNRDGYQEIVKVFSRNSCRMILPGMDLLDEQHPHESLSSPESLLMKIKESCRKYDVEVSGQNLRVSGATKSFEQIKKNLSGENRIVDLFIYQRMGAEFFSPEHFRSFAAFVRSLDQAEVDSDDLAMNEDRQMQAALSI